MSQDSVIIILTVFVGLVAVSQLLQAMALMKMRQSAETLQKQISDFLPRAQAVLEDAEKTLVQSRKQLAEVSEKANAVLDATRAQLATVETLLTDFSSRAKVQLDRAEMVLDDTMGRVHETVATVHNGVMKPLREISGISAGIRAALGQLIKGGGRPTVAQATSDEEMFI